MKIAIAVFLATALVLSSVQAADAVRSGLQPGEKITTIFEPLNLNGQKAGEPYCLICENGLSPVAMVFARELNEPVRKLLQRLDQASVEQKAQELGAFAVFLNEDDKLREQLASTAKKDAYQRLIVGTYAPPGPDGFAVSPAAEVTVVLYTEHEVKANHAFRPGELNEAAIAAIVRDLRKILPSK